jgi:hypothetical protein
MSLQNVLLANARTANADPNKPEYVGQKLPPQNADALRVDLGTDAKGTALFVALVLAYYKLRDGN